MFEEEIELGLVCVLSKPLCDSLLDHLSRSELTRNSTVRVQVRSIFFERFFIIS